MIEARIVGRSVRALIVVRPDVSTMDDYFPLEVHPSDSTKIRCTCLDPPAIAAVLYFNAIIERNVKEKKEANVQ